MTTGYLLPTSTVGFPNSLTLTQFLQTVLTGVSGLNGSLVRPKWQVEPPKQPDLNVNWLAMGIEVSSPDDNGYVGYDAAGNPIYQRHEELEVSCDVFGPDALETCGLIRDGLQIQQNRYQLFQNNMGFINVSPARVIPDLVNERFIKRYVMSVFFRREVQRSYRIPTILSASGTLYTVVGNEEFLLPFAVTPP